MRSWPFAPLEVQPLRHYAPDEFSNPMIAVGAR